MYKLREYNEVEEMALSSGDIRSVRTGLQSPGITAVPTRERVHLYEEEAKPIIVPATKIKYHKIKTHDKYKVTGRIPEYYVSDIPVPQTNINKLVELSSKYKLVSFKPIDTSQDFYLKNCYMIDYILSPIRYRGEGTKAVRSLLEKSLADKETEGRIVVDVKIIDKETSAVGFFYKLGFKFIDENKNEIMKEWASAEEKLLSPKFTGIMYLPKENINKLMMYRILL